MVAVIHEFFDAQGAEAARKSNLTSRLDYLHSSGYERTVSADEYEGDKEFTDEAKKMSEIRDLPKLDNREKEYTEESEKSVQADHSSAKHRRSNLNHVTDNEDTKGYFSASEKPDLESKDRDDFTGEHTEAERESKSEMQKYDYPHSSTGMELTNNAYEIYMSATQSATSDSTYSSDTTGTEGQDKKRGIGEKHTEEEKIVILGHGRVNEIKNVREQAEQPGMVNGNEHELEQRVSEEDHVKEQKDTEKKEVDETQEVINENSKEKLTKTEGVEGDADRGLEGGNPENGAARQGDEDGVPNTEKPAADGGMAACSCQQSQTVTLKTIDAACSTDGGDIEDADHLDKGDEDSIREGGSGKIQRQQLAGLQTYQLIAVASLLGISDRRLDALKSRYSDEESFRNILIDRCIQMGTTSQLCTILLLLLKTDSNQSTKTKTSREDPPRPTHCSFPASFHQQHFPPLFTGLPNSCLYPQNVWGQTPDMFSSLSATNPYTSQQVQMSGQASTTATNLHGVHTGTPPGSVPAQNQDMQQHANTSLPGFRRYLSYTSPTPQKVPEQTQQSMKVYFDTRFTQMESRMREMEKEMKRYVQMELEKDISNVHIWTQNLLEAQQVQLGERVSAVLQSAATQMVEERSSNCGDTLVIGNRSDVSHSDSDSTDS